MLKKEMKLVCLLSSGIDSPVASKLMSGVVDELILVHGDIRPFCDDNEELKFRKVVESLRKIVDCRTSVVVVSHGPALEAYKKQGNERFTCVFCKRMLLRYAEEVARRKGAVAIVMGDSLGQVASQTLQNIQTIENVVGIPVLRPLIGFDKQEILELARKFGTYESSILPSGSCLAVPSKPATCANIKQVEEEESYLAIDELVNAAVDQAEEF